MTNNSKIISDTAQFDLSNKQLNLLKTFLAALFVSAASAMSSFIVIFDKICPSPTAGKKILQDNYCLIVLFFISMVVIGLGFLYGLQIYYMCISNLSKQAINNSHKKSVDDLVKNQNAKLMNILIVLYISTPLWVLPVYFIGSQALHAKLWQ